MMGGALSHLPVTLYWEKKIKIGNVALFLSLTEACHPAESRAYNLAVQICHAAKDHNLKYFLFTKQFTVPILGS